MEALRFTSYVIMLLGMASYGWVSFFRRIPGAPGVGAGGRRLPWQGSEWFAPTHFRVRLVGYVLWMLGCAGVVAVTFFNR